MRKLDWKRAVVVGLMAMLWLVLPACNDSDSDSGKTSDIYTPIDYETGQQLEALVEARRQAYGIPGIVLAIRKSGQPTWSTAAGFSDLETSTPMRLDDTCRIGSNSKTFTGAMVLRIMKDKGYGLDEPVVDHLPDLGIWLDDYEGTHGLPIADIRIRHLLQHTSGLLNFTENPVWAGYFMTDGSRQFAPRDLLDLADIPEYAPEFAPGQSIAYSNTNYVLLGLLIEAWTNSSYEDVIFQELIRGKGLYDTAVPRTGEYTMALASANGYWSQGYLDLNRDGTITADEKVSDQDPSFTWASGNITATADDLLTWVIALGRGEITPFMKPQKNPFLPFVPGMEYGLGIVRDVMDPANPNDDMYGHQGGSLGYQSVMMYLPDKDAAVVCWYNVTLPSTVKNYAEVVVYDALDIVFPGR